MLHNSSVATDVVYVRDTDDLPVLASETPAISLAGTSGAPAAGSVPSTAVLLSTLVGTSNITDADGNGYGAQTPGIAITAADTSLGVWWYTTNGGAAWQQLTSDGGASISVHNALNLAFNSLTYLYFQPAAGKGGTVADALTFRAWDQSAMTGANLSHPRVSCTTSIRATPDLPAPPPTTASSSPIRPRPTM